MSRAPQFETAKDGIRERHMIALLNDNFRRSFIGGRVHLTLGVSELPIDVKAQALLRVQSFDDFTKDNDPYKEHDFGRFEVNGQQFFWKIDYYDLNCEFASEDPTNPEVTIRVLTIMLSEEY
jgi:uncharacterized protein DUF3768